MSDSCQDKRLMGTEIGQAGWKDHPACLAAGEMPSGCVLACENNHAIKMKQGVGYDRGQGSAHYTQPLFSSTQTAHGAASFPHPFLFYCLHFSHEEFIRNWQVCRAQTAKWAAKIGDITLGVCVGVSEHLHVGAHSVDSAKKRGQFSFVLTFFH